jgi:hypothetical protein
MNDMLEVRQWKIVEVCMTISTVISPVESSIVYEVAAKPTRLFVV